jgi:hypothetical protein
MEKYLFNKGRTGMQPDNAANTTEIDMDHTLICHDMLMCHFRSGCAVRLSHTPAVHSPVARAISLISGRERLDAIQDRGASNRTELNITWAGARAMDPFWASIVIS